MAVLSTSVCAVALGCGSTAAESQPPLLATRCCSEILVLGGDGIAKPLTEGEQPKWSPDHQQLAFTRADYEVEPPTNDIWSIRRNGAGLERLTAVLPPNQVRFIAFGGRPPIIAYDDDFGIWTMRPDGSERHNLVRVGGNANALAISPDGSEIAYAMNSTVRSPFSLRIINTHTAGIEVAFGGTSHTCSVDTPSWSPDSRWIAFDLCVDKGGFSVETGIWVVGADGSDLHEIVTTGSSPTWSPNGEWIAFDTGKVRPGTDVELTAVAKVHPDGSGRELMTPYAPEGPSGPYEDLDW